MNPKVDEYLERIDKWQEELSLLRKIILDCGLAEDYKWKQPCYTLNGKNILIIGGFKNSCVINFFKGALLKDDHEILLKPGENSQSARFIQFTETKQILDLEKIIKSYIYEAIEVEKAGLKINPKKTSDYDFPEEFQVKLDANKELKEAFEKLTPGRQKAYILHFSGAKQVKTRENRVEKYIPRILDGIGFYDCVCGFSARMPYCDGSHQRIEK